METIWIIYRDWGDGDYGEPMGAFANEADAIEAATQRWGKRRNWEITEMQVGAKTE